MNTTLIPVFAGTLQNQSVQLCNARDLHAFLQVGKVFAAWIKDRIEQYGFVEGEDFILCFPNLESKRRGGNNRTDYHLTLDTAKELAMVENNEQGRLVRRYFIQLEREAGKSITIANTTQMIERGPIPLEKRP
jgi:anti-repressor protein